MKAHIIPQSYLKGFVDPETPEGWEPYLHLYDFSIGTWSRRAPAKALRETDYYALPGKEGKEKDALDHGPMGAIEGRAAAIARDKIARELPLTAEEKRDYAEFLALMIGRVPAHRERMDRIITDIATLPTRLAVKYNPELYQRMAEDYERKTGQKAPTAAEWAMLDEGKITIRASQGEQLQGMAGVLDLAPIAISQMRWLFYHAIPPTWFITSDNPVSLRVPDHPEWGIGLARKDIQLTFPVTRSIGLAATWAQDGDAGDSIHIDLPMTVEVTPGVNVTFDDRLVSGANILQVAYATQFIASPTQQFPGAEVLPEKAYLPAFFNDLASGGFDEDHMEEPVE